MGRVRIRGLVKFADLVRRQLARPISPAALERLRGDLAGALEGTERILRDHRARPGDLPPASRKAYAFLKGVELDAVSPCDDADADRHRPGTVSLPGLRGFVRDVLNGLAAPTDPARLDRLAESVRHAARDVEEMLQREGIRPDHLKDASRALRGWVACFARPERFDAYVAAVARARPVLERYARASATYRPPVTVHFAAMKGMYRLRARPSGTLVILPAPMVAFSAEAFEHLAAWAFGAGGRRQPVVEEMLRPGYQATLADLEGLAGAGGRCDGAFHSLAAAFDRVNAAYFGGGMPRPDLTWSRTFTMRKFGHYDHVRDSVMVSSSLDSDAVAEFVVDFIVYHELLHKELGVGWTGSRRAVHTGEFRRREKRFARLAEAKAALARLAKG